MPTFYLGPEGSFTNQAARTLSNDTLIPVKSPQEATRLAEEGSGQAVIALENSLEGPVTESIDSLLRSSNVVISKEYNLPVSFSLFRLPEDHSPLQGVISHPVALAQCSKAISGLETQRASSTSAAIKDLLRESRSGWAAIASGGAREGLREVAKNIEDGPAITRFVLLDQTCPKASEDDKSAFVFTPKHDRPGILHDLLGSFAGQKINLYAVKSRPSKQLLGEYIFYIECAGHITNPNLQSALREVSQKDFAVRFLGSFPRDPLAGTKSAVGEGETLSEMLGKVS